MPVRKGVCTPAKPLLAFRLLDFLSTTAPTRPITIEHFITSVLHNSHRSYSAGEVAEAIDLAGERLHVEGPAGELILGVPPDFTLLGQAQLVMTEAGRRWHAEQQRARGSRIGREEASRDAVLRGLYRLLDASEVHHLSVADLGPHGYFYDEPFTEAEVTEAGKWLHHHGYIGGVLAGGVVLIRPTMEPRGSRMATSIRSVNDENDAVAVHQTTNTIPLPSPAMDPKRAADELRLLAEQAADPDVRADGPAHDAWKAKVETVMLASLDPGSPALRKFKDMSYNIGVYTGAPGEAETDALYLAKQVDRAKAQIEAAVYELQLRPAPIASAHPTPPRLGDGPIFVVHGHDDAHKYELVRLLERTTDRDAKILHEQPNRGATVLEKLEQNAASAAFAVVLLTADDEGRVAGGGPDLRPRARQNVILELGLFIGLLGRDHVAVLVDPGVERPSDLDGLMYIALDAAGAWKNTLLAELAAADIAVDYSRVP